MLRDRLSIERTCPAGALVPAVSWQPSADLYTYGYTYSYTNAVRGRFMTLSFGDAMRSM